MQTERLEYLFVYGSLMSSVKSPLGTGPRRTLRRHARLIGEASIQARLFDLGDHPAALESPDIKDLVWGELWQLGDPERVLAVLDRYEGVGADHPAGPLSDKADGVEEHGDFAAIGRGQFLWVVPFDSN